MDIKITHINGWLVLLERNWNVRIPGFAADEIRSLRKPVLPSSHQSKVQAVKTAKAQGSSGQHSKKDNN